VIQLSTQTDKPVTLTDWLRKHAAGLIRPIVGVLAQWSVRPNQLTWLGFLLTAGVGVVLALGRLQLGGVLMLLTSSIDGLDGSLARETGQQSRFGAFLDSTLDRLSEGGVLFGLVVWAMNSGEGIDLALLFLILLGSVMVSYTRARAEGLGYTCEVGLFTRAVRVFFLAVGLIVPGILRLALASMAILTWFTVAQRMTHVHQSSLPTS
jgi:CDP-diacylglycerol---glycerol-3-phosphate 3-phosphatidyltransferase